MKTKLESNVVQFDDTEVAVQIGFDYSQALSTQDDLAINFASSEKIDSVKKNQDGKKFVTYQDVSDYITKFMSASGNYSKIRYGIAKHQVAKHYTEDDTVYLKPDSRNGYVKTSKKDATEVLTPLTAYLVKDTVISVLENDGAKTNPFKVRGKSMKSNIMPLRKAVQVKVRKPYQRFHTKLVSILAGYNSIETPKDSDDTKAIKAGKTFYNSLEKSGDVDTQKILMKHLPSKYTKNL